MLHTTLFGLGLKLHNLHNSQNGLAQMTQPIDSPSLFLGAQGYRFIVPIGDKWCAILPMFATVGLFVGLHKLGYERRYCYEEEADVLAAMITWNGKGHPPGPWIKCKGVYDGKAVDMLNPELEA